MLYNIFKPFIGEKLRKRVLTTPYMGKRKNTKLFVSAILSRLREEVAPRQDFADVPAKPLRRPERYRRMPWSRASRHLMQIQRGIRM